MIVCITALLSGSFLAAVVPVTAEGLRSSIAVGATDFLTLERGTGSVLVGEDRNGDGDQETRQRLLPLVTVYAVRSTARLKKLVGSKRSTPKH